MSSKRDIKSELSNNSIIGGFIAKEPEKDAKKNVKKDNSTKQDQAIKKAFTTMGKMLDDIKNRYKYKNGIDKNQNYTFSLKIDADIEQFLKHIDTITFIESFENKGETKSTPKNDYINDLIRQDMLKRLNIKPDEDNPDVWINAYNDYAKKYGLKDK